MNKKERIAEARLLIEQAKEIIAEVLEGEEYECTDPYLGCLESADANLDEAMFLLPKEE